MIQERAGREHNEPENIPKKQENGESNNEGVTVEPATPPEYRRKHRHRQPPTGLIIERPHWTAGVFLFLDDWREGKKRWTKGIV